MQLHYLARFNSNTGLRLRAGTHNQVSSRGCGYLVSRVSTFKTQEASLTDYERL